MTQYVVKLSTGQRRDLWADDDGAPTDQLQFAAHYDSATQATLAGILLPYPFKVQPIRESALTKGTYDL